MMAQLCGLWSVRLGEHNLLELALLELGNQAVERRPANETKPAGVTSRLDDAQRPAFRPVARLLP